MFQNGLDRTGAKFIVVALNKWCQGRYRKELLKDLELATVSFSSITTRVHALETFDGELRKIW